MLTIFTLASGRSGTSYLAEFFKHNIRDCYSTHEPYLDLRNPTLFGEPIFYNSTLQDEKLDKVLSRKKERIDKLKTPSYFESNHAFLKAANRLAANYFPNLGLVHLIREPTYVAKSELNREMILRKAKIPWIDYRAGRGEKLFKWSLTGYENIFNDVNLSNMSRFQFYLIQWIEIENRAMRFLNENQLWDRCFCFHMPDEINSENTLVDMVNYFDLRLKGSIKLCLKTNQTPFVPKTVISTQDQSEFREVVEHMPSEYLTIFSELPYKEYSWSKHLRK